MIVVDIEGVLRVGWCRIESKLSAVLPKSLQS
jgi:hypothetical protein